MKFNKLISFVIQIILISTQIVFSISASAAACTTSSTTSGGYTYLAFKTIGSCTWDIPANVNSIDYLVVGGGGGGGTRHSGGGGAGGLLQGNASVIGVSTISVTVGDGGAGGDTAISGMNYALGTSGETTTVSKSVGSGTFATLNAVGGGGGTTASPSGYVGGSGGGALTTGGNPIAGQGNSGGNGYTNSSSYWGGGGGGGAGAAGKNASNGVAGNGDTGTAWTGVGFTTSIASALSLTNTSNTYFAGGGGGGATSGTIGKGGLGGGGDGTASATDAGNGIANTGGGGGGGGLGATVPKGGKGGSGVVLIRYAAYPVVSSSPVISGTSAYGQQLITSSGTWNNTPTSYNYQWLRATTSGGTFSSIAGATSSTYTLTSTDIGKFLKVVVTATNVGGVSTDTSSATAAITAATSSTSVSIAVGTLTFRTTKAISATPTVAGKLTFRANNVIIPGCKNLVAQANTAKSCNYRPNSRGYVTITVTLVPTDTGYSNSSTTSDKLFVYQRSGSR